jgi:hypothetical protein
MPDTATLAVQAAIQRWRLLRIILPVRPLSLYSITPTRVSVRPAATDPRLTWRKIPCPPALGIRDVEAHVSVGEGMGCWGDDPSVSIDISCFARFAARIGVGPACGSAGSRPSVGVAVGVGVGVSIGGSVGVAVGVGVGSSIGGSVGVAVGVGVGSSVGVAVGVGGHSGANAIAPKAVLCHPGKYKNITAPTSNALRRLARNFQCSWDIFYLSSPKSSPGQCSRQPATCATCSGQMLT